MCQAMIHGSIAIACAITWLPNVACQCLEFNYWFCYYIPVLFAAHFLGWKHRSFLTNQVSCTRLDGWGLPPWLSLEAIYVAEPWPINSDGGVGVRCVLQMAVKEVPFMVAMCCSVCVTVRSWYMWRYTNLPPGVTFFWDPESTPLKFAAFIVEAQCENHKESTSGGPVGVMKHLVLICISI